MRPRFRFLTLLSLTVFSFPADSLTRAQEFCGDGDGACATVNGECGTSPFGSGVGAGPGANRACQWYRPYTEQSQPDIFYNYYALNNYGNTAAAFPAPYPTPSLVGHTYYTYQPLMPNEFLYRHHRSYHQYYNNGMGLNRTRVAWHHSPLPDGILKFYRWTVWK